ncbi:TPA: hypothetical protein ACWR31_005069, partial [Escherichia coli]
PVENLGCPKQKIMKNNRLQKSRFASFSKTPLNPVEIQYSCGFSAYHLSKNRAYVLNVTSGSLPLPRRFARYARSSTCGERDHLSHVVGDPVVVLSGMSRQIALQTRSEALRRTKRV